MSLAMTQIVLEPLWTQNTRLGWAFFVLDWSIGCRARLWGLLGAISLSAKSMSPALV